MARDIFHNAVRQALEAEGWEITHDPYLLKALGTNTNIDLGAEKLIAAQRDKHYIAVEIKSFLTPSLTYEFHRALGQYMNYLFALNKSDSTRKLYLAIGQDAYKTFFKKPEVWEVVENFKIPIIVFDENSCNVISWFEHN